MPLTPSQIPTVDVTPKPPNPTPTVSPGPNTEEHSLWNRARELARSRGAVLFSLLIVAVIATLVALHLSGALSLTSRAKLLEYRIVRETLATNESPSSVTSVRSGEGISFEFRPAEPGRLCLLYQDDYGFLLWLNPLENGDAQYAHSERWLRVPAVEKKWILIDKKPRTEKFWLIFIPEGLDWSVAKAVFPGTISVRSGVAEIASEAANNLITKMKNEGLELKPSTESNTPIELSKNGRNDQIAFYMIELEHTQ